MNEKKTLSILIIEDNAGDFLLIRDYLEEQFHAPSVEHARKFEEALPFLDNTALHFDVILLDLTLPDKSGESLITDVVDRRPKTPVIVLTGYGNLDFGIRSLSLRAADYLLKDDINASSLEKSIVYNIERKRTNTLLEESEKRYSSLFQLSPQPMWIIDTEQFRFVQVNLAAIEKYGYTEDEFRELSLFDIVQDEFSVEDKRKLATAVSHSSIPYKGRYRHKTKSGSILDVDTYANTIKINEEEFESAIIIDMTESIRTEQMITKAIIKTQEDERYEIGTELHDNVCQILASTQLSLDMLQDNLDAKAVTWHSKTKQFINLALDEIRNISHRLAPSFFDQTTIQDTFTELIDNFNPENKYEIMVSLDTETLSASVSRDMQLNLYRILQEQLRNISKYANAKQIEISLHKDSNWLHFIIADDGVGFDPNTTKKGIGLANIRRRAELFSGTLEIESAPQNGCRMKIRIPLNQ